MIFNKKARVVACILATSLILPACKTGDKRETVELTVWASEQDQELVKAMVDSFEEEYKDEAKFKITICEENEGTCKDTVMFCPEAAADVYAFADDQLLSLVEANALYKLDYDVDAVIEENGGSDAAAIDAVTYNGDIYAYPSTASNGYFMYYNADYFSEEDVRSLDKMLEICEENGKHFGLEFTSGWYMYSFFKGAGLDVEITEDGKNNECNWNATNTKYKGVDVAQALLDIATHKGFVNVGNDDLVSGVQGGDIIACISGTWNAQYMQESYGDGYRACMLPTYKVAGDLVQMHSVAGFKLVGVNAYTKNPEWAQKLARWMTNEENQLLRFRMKGEGPSNRKASNSEEVQASVAIAALVKQSEYGHLQRVADSYWNAAYRFGNILSSGNIENTPLQELLDELVKSCTTAE